MAEATNNQLVSTKSNRNFPAVTLLVTHYNRSQSLQCLLQAFRNVRFAEIVVSDDCSQAAHLAALEDLSTGDIPFKLLKAPKNGGLGNNINKGQDHIRTPYTLYVQEDFVPTEKFLEKFQNALDMMEGDKTIDFIRFYGYLRYPYLKPTNEFGFAEMYLPSLAYKYKKIYQYSDHPHLRRSNFLTKFGRYKEGVSVDRSEYNMCISFLRNRGRAYFYNDFQTLFDQRNTNDEPSTIDRRNWRNSSNFFIGALRNVYRQAKYNFDIYVRRQIGPDQTL